MITATTHDLQTQLDDMIALFQAKAGSPPSELSPEIYSLWDGELDDILADISDLQDAILAERFSDPAEDAPGWMAHSVEAYDDQFI